MVVCLTLVALAGPFAWLEIRVGTCEMLAAVTLASMAPQSSHVSLLVPCGENERSQVLQSPLIFTFLLAFGTSSPTYTSKEFHEKEAEAICKM